MSDKNQDRSGLRESFRFPGSADQGIQFSVSEKVYELADIGSNGVGVYIDNIQEFGSVGETVNAMLLCGDVKVEMECRIAHVTEEDNDVIRCGLEFCSLGEKVESKLFECLSRSQASYFSGI